MTPAKTSAKVTPHGKFFRRFGQKFFFKAMRFAQPGDSFDLTRKLALRQRFEELSRGHTTGLTNHGTIKVESREGSGTAVSICLPTAAASIQ